jgi:hypothetical protein
MSLAVDLRHLDYAKRDRFYIAANDWNLAWTAEELETVREMRERGAKVWEVAEAVDRPDYEVAVLIMSLEERGKE